MKTPKISTLVFAGVGLAATLYVAYGTVVFTVQRSILYKIQTPESALPATPRWIEADGAKVEARWDPALDSNAQVDSGAKLDSTAHVDPNAKIDSNALVGIFIHGNAETIDDWPLSIADWNRRGVSVLRVEFPGYGHSTGEPPTQDRIRAVMEKAFDDLVAQGIPPSRIFVAGRSLGGGIACDLSTTRPLGGLFLQSTFHSVRDRGSKEYHLPGFLVRDGFENTKALARFEYPVLLVHGTNDQRIPFGDLARLQEVAPHAKSVVFTGYGHSDIPGPDSTLYWTGVEQFLTDLREKSGRRGL